MKRITVITINYNNLQGLRRTVPSVLSQTFTDYEYVVVDGGSNDGSKEYIESQTGIDRWVSEKDGGIYNAMNKAVGMASGEYCIFMNSGDHFFSPRSLEDAAAELGGTDYCTGQTVIVDDYYVYLCQPPQQMSSYFIKGTSLQHQSTFIRTSLLREHPYDESLKIVSDWAHFFELWTKGECSYKAITPIVATFYLDGISSARLDLRDEEMVQVITRQFGSVDKMPVSRETKEQKRERMDDRLRFKLRRAMRLSPLKRDMKIMRNGLKFFFRDLFR